MLILNQDVGEKRSVPASWFNFYSFWFDFYEAFVGFGLPLHRHNYYHSTEMNFTELYQTYYCQLTEVANRWVPEEDARDMVQDVFLALLEKPELLHTLADVYAYVYTAVRNRCLDRLRHDAYRREYANRAWALIVDTINLETPATLLHYRETRLRIIQAIDRLPRRSRQVFMLSREQGLKYHAIATTLGISVNTVENHMALALARLRKAIPAA